MAVQFAKVKDQKNKVYGVKIEILDLLTVVGKNMGETISTFPCFWVIRLSPSNVHIPNIVSFESMNAYSRLDGAKMHHGFLGLPLKLSIYRTKVQFFFRLFFVIRLLSHLIVVFDIAKMQTLSRLSR